MRIRKFNNVNSIYTFIVNLNNLFKLNSLDNNIG